LVLAPMVKLTTRAPGVALARASAQMAVAMPRVLDSSAVEAWLMP